MNLLFVDSFVALGSVFEITLIMIQIILMENSLSKTLADKKNKKFYVENL